ncbi:MAG: T9SS type A sorting domain-containing protein [Lewinellaceae bacterium]|nr:T9SS type A sorting domain-containing protein [Lewinellaceae bacterium]
MRKFLFLLIVVYGYPAFCQDFTTKFVYDEIGSIGVADFNGDGYQDAVGIYFGAFGNRLYLFTNKKETDVSFDTKAISTSSQIKGQPLPFDFDGDGDQDILLANGDNDDLVVLVNNGAAAFTSTPLGVSGSVSFYLADADNDQDMDIFGVSYTTNSVLLYTNLGSNQYSKQTIYQGSASFSSAVYGDINKDGLVDIVISETKLSGDQVMVLENKGNGIFDKKVIYKDKYPKVYRTVITDINKDGYEDLLLLEYDDIILSLNKGNFEFEDMVFFKPKDGYIYGADIADVTGEGIKDLIIGTTVNTVWLKNIDETNYSYEERDFSKYTGFYKFFPCDLNNDNAIDIVCPRNGFYVNINNVTQIPNSVYTPNLHQRLFPNPTSDFIVLEDFKDQYTSVKIYNLNGQLIQSMEKTDNTVDISKLRNGYYRIQLLDKNGHIIHNGKFLKN